jgi:hypothetical protein
MVLGVVYIAERDALLGKVTMDVGKPVRELHGDEHAKRGGSWAKGMKAWSKPGRAHSPEDWE